METAANSTTSSPSERYSSSMEATRIETKTCSFLSTMRILASSFCVCCFFSLTSSFLLSQRVLATSSKCLASTTDDSISSSATMKPLFYQHTVSITAPSRGCHLISSQIQNAIENDLSQIEMGLMNLFIQHS
jgi:hypothetical protein